MNPDTETVTFLTGGCLQAFVTDIQWLAGVIMALSIPAWAVWAITFRKETKRMRVGLKTAATDLGSHPK